MSLTTTGGGGNRLTRSQQAQMPALLEFYSPSAALLDVRQKGMARGVIWSVATLFIACTAASALIPIVVQPLETSIVRRLLVQEGETVHKGDLLAQLDPTFTTSDKTSLGQSVASLRAEVERLRAENAGVDYRPSALDSASEVQSQIFTQRRAERAFRLENYKQKVDGLLATLAKAAGDMRSYTERMQVAATVEGKRRELAALGVGSQLNLLQATDQRMTMQAGLQAAQQTAKTAAGDLAAMRAEAAAYDQDWHAKVSQETTEQTRKLDEAQGNLTKANLRSGLTDIRADVDAVVFNRAPVSPGSVLQSGDQLFKLVPLNAPLEIEASVSGSDAGFVHVGDPVTIKFDTLPFVQYGSAQGTVRVVSPDSYTAQQQQQADQTVRGTQPSGQPPATGQSFYRIKITIERVELHDTPRGFRVSQGMPITADVMVGKRTVLSYIFSRALPTLSEGMREP